MEADMKCVKFFRIWHELAEGRDTDEKRLAFYDALLGYAFTGKRPKDPLKLVSPTGQDYAAYDAVAFFGDIDRQVGHHRGQVNATRRLG